MNLLKWISSFFKKQPQSRGNYINGIVDPNQIAYPDNRTGTSITYDKNAIYGDADSPETGNLTSSYSGAVYGVTQKIYHNDSSAPTVPASWVLIGDGVYINDVLNIIYSQYLSDTRVEYWITQEQVV